MSKPASFACAGETGLQGEAQAVGGRLHHLVADLLRVPAGGEEVRGERRLPARELHRHLPPRLEGDGVVEDVLDLLHRELVDVAHLVRVHEAGLHIMLQRFVRSMVSTAPRPYLMRGRAVAVESSSPTVLKSRPGKRPSMRR